MIEARRKCLPDLDKEPNRKGASHPGLILSRYLEQVQVTEKSDVSEESPGAKGNVFKAATKSLESDSIEKVHQLAFERWREHVEALEKSSLAKKIKVRTASRLIIGLGNESTTETGITLHHTYGVPYLPGTALKGLAAHYAHTVYGATNCDWKFAGHLHRVVFGTDQDEGHAGLVEFSDGWLDPASIKTCLLDDVMTPHHGEYYASEGDAEATDFDDPGPVPFLSVRGTFHIASIRRTAELPVSYLESARILLKNALETWGIGGKTSSGYGRLEETPRRGSAK